MLPSCHEKRLKGNNDVLGDTSIAELLIQRFSDAAFNQFIIIDGLDEIETRQRKSLMHFLTGIVEECDKYNPGKIRLLFISHDLADVRKMKCMESAVILELNPINTQEAIENFVNQRIDKLKKKLPLTDQDLKKIRQLIIARSGGKHFITII